MRQLANSGLRTSRRGRRDADGADEISIAQEGVEVVVARSQLTDVADKLYFLDQAFRAEARDVVEALCE